MIAEMFPNEFERSDNRFDLIFAFTKGSSTKGSSFETSKEQSQGFEVQSRETPETDYLAPEAGMEA